jgi:hypothetical protein
MNSTLLQQLVDAGFLILTTADGKLITPSLSSLIEACGENFGTLSQNVEQSLWEATSKIEKDKPAVRGLGVTPSEAVASLWLAWINGVNKP